MARMRSGMLRSMESPGRRSARARSCVVRSALLWRARRPRLDQRVVVDRLALRLLVRELALRRDVAVLLRLLEPEVGRLLRVQLRSAVALHVGAFEPAEHLIL